MVRGGVSHPSCVGGVQEWWLRPPFMFSFLLKKRSSCPSAEERSDVSTRAQCRGQGATPPPMVCGAELGDDHVDLITFSWISVSLIQSRGGLPSHKQSEIFDSAVPKPKVLFCFCFVFLVSLLVAFGWPRQGGQSCQASSRRCRLAWSQKHRHRPARRRLRGEAAFSQFHPLVNTHHSHTHPPSSVFS